MLVTAHEENLRVVNDGEYVKLLLRASTGYISMAGTGSNGRSWELCAKGFKEGGGVVGVRTLIDLASYWPTD